MLLVIFIFIERKFFYSSLSSMSYYATLLHSIVQPMCYDAPFVCKQGFIDTQIWSFIYIPHIAASAGRVQ